MKLISVAVFSFAIALLALAFGLKAPAILSATPTTTQDQNASDTPEEAPLAGPQSLDSHAREALEAAQRRLALALTARTEAEAARATARAQLDEAQAAFEAMMVDFTEAEIAVEAAGKHRRRSRAAAKKLKLVRKTTLGAEARLREAREALHAADEAYEKSEAMMSQARASLHAVTAQALVTPPLLESA